VDINKEKYLFARQHARWEKFAAKVFYKAIKKSSLPAIKSLNPEDVDKTVWIYAYREVYATIGVYFAQYEYKRQKSRKDDLLDLYNISWRNSMYSEASNAMVSFGGDLSDTTINEIRSALSYAISQDYTNDEIRRYLFTEYLLNRGSKRALVLGRTETTTASSIGKMQGAQSYFSEIGEDEGYKMWISRADAAVRHSHRNENETIIPFNDKFITTLGNAGKYPSDISLPPADRANCRCTFVLLSKRGAERRFRMGTGKPQE